MQPTRRCMCSGGVANERCMASLSFVTARPSTRSRAHQSSKEAQSARTGFIFRCFLSGPLHQGSEVANAGAKIVISSWPAGESWRVCPPAGSRRIPTESREPDWPRPCARLPGLGAPGGAPEALAALDQANVSTCPCAGSGSRYFSSLLRLGRFCLSRLPSGLSHSREMPLTGLGALRALGWRERN